MSKDYGVQDFLLLLRKIIGFLFLKNPVATSAGVLVGWALDGLAGAFGTMIKNWASIELSNVKIWHYTALGVLGCNIPGLWRLKRDELPPEIVKALLFIRESEDSGKISKVLVSAMYRDLWAKVLASVTLDQSTTEQVTKIKTAIETIRGSEDIHS